MIAGIYNMTCEQGSTFLRVFKIEQPDLLADPTGNTFENYDLSCHSARMQIRRTADSDYVIINVNSSSASAPGRLEVNPASANNQIHVFLSDAVTASITTSGVYDLEVIAPNGFVSKVVRGTFTLIPEVTK
jgi:hypothetical protein